MSGFLSKSKQKLEHSSKLSAGEFKALGAVLGTEKNLLNSHTKNAADTKKAANALDEWAQAEGPDLGVSVKRPDCIELCAVDAPAQVVVVYIPAH